MQLSTRYDVLGTLLCFFLMLALGMPFITVAAPIEAQLLYQHLQQEGVAYFEASHADSVEQHGDVLVASHKGEQTLSVFDQDTHKLIYRFSLEGYLDDFVRLQWVDVEGYHAPLIASVWRRGAHGEQLIVLDPLNRKTLYRLTSSWPLSFKASEQGLVITITGDADAQGVPVLEKHHWPDLIGSLR